MYNCKPNQGVKIYFCLLFLFFFFSISQSNVMNMEIFMKDFSGTAFPRILKFGKNIRYDKLYCVYYWDISICLSVTLFVHFSFFSN